MTSQHSAWQPLVDDWVAREQRIASSTPVRADSVRVRDAVEIGDNVFVLVSYDVDVPWPVEEEAPGETSSANTAVLQALRVRQPWIERDSTRALAQYSTADGTARVFEHPLGAQRAFSGRVSAEVKEIELEFEDDGETVSAQVVDGWFLAVVPEQRRVAAIAGLSGTQRTFHSTLVSDFSGDVIEATQFARTGGRSLYFSPLDLRAVHPLLRWERTGKVAVVASCIEQYDEGGVLRLRIDGIRRDDDLFVTWPKVSLDVDGTPLASVVYGEYGSADTASLDIGFQPWDPNVLGRLRVRIAGMRSAYGNVPDIELRVDARPVPHQAG